MTPKEVLQKWIEAFNKADSETISELYAENATNHQVTNEPVVGKENIKQMFVDEFATAEMVCILENIFQDGGVGYFGMERPVRISRLRIFSNQKR